MMMSAAMEFLSMKNPNHHLHSSSFSSLERLGPSVCSSTTMAFLNPSSSPPRQFNILLNRLPTPRVCRLSIHSSPPTALGGVGILPSLHRSNSFLNRPIVAFAASHEESSKHPEIEIDVEKPSDDLKLGADESQEAWKQTLESFKEQALKMQSLSQEAYDVYSKKAIVILKETSEQLKIQADKAKYDLAVLAKEISEGGKEYLSTAAENSPEQVKDIVETFSSPTDDLDDLTKVRDFYLGIPYGLFLTLGGFLSFMLTGSVPAIRFGIILGGVLLALSVSSLRSYKRGETHTLALKGQAAIAAIIFLREISLLSQKASFFTFLTTIVSGAMFAFYLYRIVLNGKQSKGSDLGHGAEY